MGLATSGIMSLGGSTAGRSVNLELGRAAGAAASLGGTAERALADRPTGSVSLSHFYGKASNEVLTMVAGNDGGPVSYRFRGFHPSFGTMTPNYYKKKAGGIITISSWFMRPPILMGGDIWLGLCPGVIPPEILPLEVITNGFHWKRPGVFGQPGQDPSNFVLADVDVPAGEYFFKGVTYKLIYVPV